MELNEKITYKSKHKRVLVLYIEKSITEILEKSFDEYFKEENTRKCRGKCSKNCTDGKRCNDFLKKNCNEFHCGGRVLAEKENLSVSNLDRSSILKEIPGKNRITTSKRNEPYSTKNWNSLICAIYKICVSAQVTFNLLCSTMIVLRNFDDKNRFSAYKKSCCNKKTKLYQKKRNTVLEELFNTNILIRFFSALIVTQKYHNDYSYTMADYHKLLLKVSQSDLSHLSLSDMNFFERYFLTKSNHEIIVKYSEIKDELLQINEYQNIPHGSSILDWVYQLFGCK